MSIQKGGKHPIQDKDPEVNPPDRNCLVHGEGFEVFLKNLPAKLDVFKGFAHLRPL
jgi:hypothetical protein